KFLAGLNTPPIQGGTKISLRYLAVASRSMQLMRHATCYARSEFQMILLIDSFRHGVGRTPSMGRPTTPRWISKPRLLSLAWGALERGNRRRRMEFKTSLCTR